MRAFCYAALALVLAACGRVDAQQAPQKTPQIVVADGTWVLDNAWQSSLAVQMELGGCARVVKQTPDTIVIDRPYVSIREISTHGVTTYCNRNEAEWHTHWAPEGMKVGNLVTVGCHPSPVDEALSFNVLNFVVCGLGPKGLIPYNWRNDGK